MSFIQTAWEKQERIEKKIQNWEKTFLKITEFHWRENDSNIFLLMVIIFFGTTTLIVLNFRTDWWILPGGLGEVALFLFIMSKPLEEE